MFGATGSVGTSTLDLVRLAPERYRVVALTAQSQAGELASVSSSFSTSSSISWCSAMP
ncbi:MAG: hypothetical protein Q8S56_09425 [Polaromonas sp.]|nr:hypothetical protein [Polaromonas sp.]